MKFIVIRPMTFHIRDESEDIGDPHEQFRVISHAYVEFAMRNPSKYRKLFNSAFPEGKWNKDRKSLYKH